MQINTDVWGTQYGKFWYSDITGNKLTNYVSENSFFTSTFKTETYNGVTYSNGQLSEMARISPAQYNQLIDESICFAAIPANSPVATISYLNRTTTTAGGVLAYSGDIPMFLSCCFYGFEENISSSMKSGGGGNSFLSNRWATWSSSDIEDVDHTIYPYSGGRLIMPIVKWNYNDVVLLLRVAVGDSLTNVESRVYDLADWEENYKAQYPYVYSVFGVPYIGKSGNRFNINNNIGVAYSGAGTSTTRSNYLRCSKNVPLTAPPNYHNNDVNDFNASDSPTVLNYSSNVLVGSRLNDYGFSVGIGNASITPNATLDTFTNTGSVNGNNGLYIYAGDSTIIESFPMGTPGNVSRVVTKIKDDVDLRKLMSWYGLQFVDHVDKVGAAVGSNDLCIPIIESGYTTGEYLTGENAANLPNANWNEDWPDKNGYDGKPAPKWDYETKLNPNTLTKMHDTFTHVYLANNTGVNNLANWLYGTLASGATTDTFLEKFMNLNPVDCIADVIMYPFTITESSVQVPMIVGNQSANLANIYYLPYDIFVLDFGTITFRKYYNDFRDFEPYSDCTLEIPYHGSVHLKPSVYAGHDISVKCIVDLLSGASLALVYRDGLVMDAIAGQIGMHLQLSGIQSANYNNALYAAANGYKQAAVGDIAKTGGALLSIAGNIGSGNFAGAVSSAFSGIMADMQSEISLNNAEYRLEHVQVPFKTRGTNSVLTSYGNEQCCRLIQTRPKMLENNLEPFAKTHGFACCINGVVSEFAGFTKFSAVDLSGVDLSAAEKSELLRILQSGVYL